MSSPNQPLDTPHQPLTQERINTFLNVLAETGSPFAAARAASPHAAGTGMTTFRHFRKKNARFAQQWQEAVDEFRGKAEAVMAVWSLKGRSRPIVDKDGNVVAHDEHPPDPRLLLAQLRRIDPSWREKSEVEHTGTINHEHSGGIVMAQIKAEDILLLSEEKQDIFTALLGEIVEARELQGRTLEHQSDE